MHQKYAFRNLKKNEKNSGRGVPSPHPIPPHTLSACGISILVPSALDSPPPNLNPAFAPWLRSQMLAKTEWITVEFPASTEGPNNYQLRGGREAEKRTRSVIVVGRTLPLIIWRRGAVFQSLRPLQRSIFVQLLVSSRSSTSLYTGQVITVHQRVSSLLPASPAAWKSLSKHFLTSPPSLNVSSTTHCEHFWLMCCIHWCFAGPSSTASHQWSFTC